MTSLENVGRIALHGTCLLVDLTGCLTRWTRSGGPNSRRACKFSVRISTTEVESSSKILFVVGQSSNADLQEVVTNSGTAVWIIVACVRGPIEPCASCVR